MVKYSFTLILLAILLAGCEDQRMKKYPWIATATTPKAFPAFLVDATLTLEDGKPLRLFLSQTQIRGKWGRSPYLDYVGEHEKYPPTALNVTWFSYAEDQLYRAHCPFELDKIKTLFASSYSEPWRGKDYTFSKVTVGVAPGGHVSVWLQGAASVLIGVCKGQKIDLPYQQWSDIPSINRQEFIALAAQEYDESDGVPPFGNPIDTSLWDRYNHWFQWQPTLVHAPEGSFFRMWTYGAEHYLFKVAKSPWQHRNAHQVPSTFIIYMERDGYQYSAKITFDEEEVFNAFAKFDKLVESEPFQLQIEVSNNLQGVAIWLKTSKHAFMFEKLLVDINKRRKK